MKKVLMVMLISILSISSFGQDSHVCSQIKKLLKTMDVNVQDVKIADGRSKGGIKAMIITFKVDYSSSNHAKELTHVLESGVVANDKINAKLDEISAIAANRNGSTLAIINATISNTRTFGRTKDPKTFVRSWNVMRVDKGYLSALLSMSKQF